MKHNHLQLVVQGLLFNQNYMKYFILIIGLIFSGSIYAQCVNDAKYENTKVLLATTDITLEQDGSIEVVGYAETENSHFPYFFEVRKGNEHGELLQKGSFDKSVSEQGRKYEAIKIKSPGNYVILSCYKKGGKDFKSLNQVYINQEK